MGSGKHAAVGGAPGAAGGAALLVGETDGLGIDFTYATDAQRVAVKVAGVTTSYGLDSFFSNTSTTPKLVFDVSGNLIWSPHNMYIQSDTPATRTVATVTGQNYTVTVTGSGSLTGSSGASGVATQASPLTFTATGASSLFTLAGSLTQVQMNRGATATAYLATTAALRNGIAVDYDPATHVGKGLLCEPAGTNLLLNNTTLSTQSVTVTAVAHTLSFLGTGTITLSGVSTAGPLVGTGASNRVSLTFTPTAGSLTLTVTGTVSNAQLETGAVATSIIRTFGATATRALDGVSHSIAATPLNASGPNSLIAASVYRATGAGTLFVISDGTNNERYMFDNFNGTKLSRLQVFDNNVLLGDLSVAGTPVVETVYKVGAALATDDLAIAVNGGAVSTDITSTLPTVTQVAFSAGTQNIRVLTEMLVPRRMSNAELQAKTT
jgi:hypothetical protein